MPHAEKKDCLKFNLTFVYAYTVEMEINIFLKNSLINFLV